ncbi:type II secretion system F family protein [Candidatus Dependentiae bacterium]|nr:type II secretion system F family protein [Candidatus Dependentiae bacterium]
MALYFYRALSQSGKKMQGQIDASSEEAVRLELLSKKLYPVEIKLQVESGESFYKIIFEQAVPFKDLIFFTKQLAILLKSGVPLVQSLDLLSEQFSGKLRSIIITLKDGVKEGKSLADCLAVYPKTFGNIYIQLVKAGEATGKLDSILNRLTGYLERQQEVEKKVSGALSQPLFQLGIIGVITVVMMTTVVPQLTGMLKSGGKELPLPTVILLAISNLLVQHYILLLGALIVITGGFIYWSSQPKGKLFLDRLKLQLPLIKYFAKIGAIVQFCSTLGMLLESGVTLSQALDIVCNIIDNSVLVEKLQEAKDKIVKQGKMTPFLKETGIFPPMAIYLLNTGEQSGNLDFMLLTVAQNYETELTELSDSLTAKLNPIMTLLTGAIVGFIMLSVIGPVFNMYDMSKI